MLMMKNVIANVFNPEEYNYVICTSDKVNDK